MMAFVTNRKEQKFFFNTEYIQLNNAAKSETRKVKVPGHNYFKKLDDFIDRIVYDYWRNVSRVFCEDESVDRTPRPFPDIQSITICHIVETPITNTENGKRREVDDYHPSALSKQVYKKNKSNIEYSASVQTFCNRYIVKESLVKKYREH